MLFRSLALRPLTGGLTNRNVIVEVDGGAERHALRIPGIGTPLLGIVRAIERDAAVAAAEAGVAPVVTAWITPEGWLATELLDASPIAPGRFAHPAGQAEIGDLLRRVHGSRAVPAIVIPSRLVELYARLAADRSQSVSGTAEAIAVVRRIEHALAGAAAPLRLCHHDLLSGNLLDDGQRILIVDWEYAGMGDPYFDLGNLSSQQAFDDAAIAELLRAWLQAEPGEHEIARVRLQRVVADLREATWSVLQEVVSTLDVDFRAFVDEYLERGFAGARAASFEDDLRLVAAGPEPRVPPVTVVAG